MTCFDNVLAGTCCQVAYDRRFDIDLRLMNSVLLHKPWSVPYCFVPYCFGPLLFCALTLFRSEKLRPEDFSTSEGGCLLGKAGRARFYAEWEPLAARLRKLLAEAVGEVVAAIVAAAGGEGQPPGITCGVPAEGPGGADR